MADTTLDRISRDFNTDARRYVASLLAMGANRGQVVDKLREKFGVTVSRRSVTAWRNNDAELIALVDELEAIRRDLAPDDNRNPADLLPEPRDRAQDVEDVFALFDDCPAYAELCVRADHDPSFDVDPHALLVETPLEELEARSRELLGSWNFHVEVGGADSENVARIERAAAEGTLSESYDDYLKRRKAEKAEAA